MRWSWWRVTSLAHDGEDLGLCSTSTSTSTLAPGHVSNLLLPNQHPHHQHHPNHHHYAHPSWVTLSIDGIQRHIPSLRFWQGAWGPYAGHGLWLAPPYFPFFEFHIWTSRPTHRCNRNCDLNKKPDHSSTSSEVTITRFHCCLWKFTPSHHREKNFNNSHSKNYFLVIFILESHRYQV